MHQSLPLSLAFSARSFGNFQSNPAIRGENPFRLQALVRASDRVGVHDQLLGQVTDAGNAIPRTQHALSDRKLDLPHDLIVNRNPVVWIDVKEHLPKLH